MAVCERYYCSSSVARSGITSADWTSASSPAVGVVGRAALGARGIVVGVVVEIGAGEIGVVVGVLFGLFDAGVHDRHRGAAAFIR